jgi:hypothetical protein
LGFLARLVSKAKTMATLYQAERLHAVHLQNSQ